MAKKTEEAKKPAVATSENIVDIIRSGNMMTQAISAEAEKRIKEEADERLTESLKCAILKADYMKGLALLQVRTDRKKATITLEKVKKAEILKDKLSGFMLTEDKIEKHGGKNGKLEIEIVSDYEKGTKEKKAFELKKGEEVFVPGSITLNEYSRELEELQREMNKKYQDVQRDYENWRNELQEKYPGYWAYDWRW